MKLTLSIKHFKKLTDISEEFTSGRLYLVKGKNALGKTSFWQALRMVFKADNPNPNILQFGTKEGFVEADIEKTEIIGSDGEKYIAKCEFKEGKEDKFTLIMPDATVRKKKTDIRDIFKYNDFTVEEFLGLGLTEPGRKKQAYAILEFLSKETQDRISEIDKLTNNKSGTLYVTRSGKNDTLQTQKRICDQTLPLTAQEEHIIGTEEKTLESLDSIKKELDALELIRTGHGDIIQQKADLNTDYNILNNEYHSKNEKHDNDIAKLQQELLDLQTMIILKKEQIENKTLEIQKYNIESEATLKDIEDRISKLAPVTFDQTKYDELKSRKEKGDTYFDAIKEAKKKKENIVLNEQRFEEAQKEWKKFDDQIEQLRIEKKTLFENAKLPMDNVIINNGELFFVDDKGNQLAFTEEQISYSVAGKRIAKLLLERNKELPIICIGKASEYDEQSLKELSELASKYDAIIFCDKVEPEQEELCIEVYEK